MARRQGRKLRVVIASAFLRWLAPIARHPAISMLTGVGLLISGVSDLLEDLFTDFESMLETYHGLILFGLVTALRGLADAVEGIDWMAKDAEAIEESETKREEAASDQAALLDEVREAEDEHQPINRPMLFERVAP
ncbi:MAG: hypothetical protein H6843_12485 [Rhodospirillaceae bacterium]|nr:hypothetical protein [Rhodospirillaceae bacterium]